MTSLFAGAKGLFRTLFTSAQTSTADLQLAKETVESIISGTPVAVFSKSYCPYCSEAKRILSSHGQDARTKILELDHEQQGSAIQQYLAERAGVSKVTVPQIFINGKIVGGCSDLKKLQSQGQLDALLA
ncbi:glutaredoxin [Sporobolomyces koalae]|uniref:glutaredoxin n=1 Tax=Sporobolomyces koalae TaxID=500713 RepID=UPI00317C5653